MCDQADVTPDNFLQYDYVGSPHSVFGVKFLNGGVSLRNVEAMKDMIQTCTYNPDSSITSGNGEDVFFSRPCRGIKKRYVVAPQKAASAFSLQQNSFYRAEKTPVAIHKPWVKHIAISNKNMLVLEKTCPGVMQMAANYKTSANK